MHDITLPTAEGTTQIDHIVFSEKGIFVIETKSHKGWIFGSEKDRNWTQVIRRMKYTFHNPIIQNNNHIKHIANLTNIDQGYINNIVVFTNPEIELKTKLPEHVLKLKEVVPYIEKHISNSFYQKRLYEVIGCIEFHRKERSMETNKKHIEFVKKRYG